MPANTLVEMKQYIADLAEGLRMRFDELDARLDRIEIDIALIKECLMTEMREAERDADAPVAELLEPRINAAFLAERLGLARSEAEIAGMMAKGMPAVRIAATTGRQPGTVNTLIQRMYCKLDLRNQTLLVARVLRVVYEEETIGWWHGNCSGIQSPRFAYTAGNAGRPEGRAIGSDGPRPLPAVGLGTSGLRGRCSRRAGGAGTRRRHEAAGVRRPSGDARRLGAPGLAGASQAAERRSGPAGWRHGATGTDREFLLPGRDVEASGVGWNTKGEVIRTHKRPGAKG